MREGGVSSVGAGANTPQTKKTVDNPEKAFENGTRNIGKQFGESLFTGDFQKFAQQTQTIIESSITEAIKSAATKFLMRLFTGNDGADAGKDASKNGVDIANGAKKLTELQQKVITSGLNALENMVQTGNLDIEAFGEELANMAITSQLESAECEEFTKEQVRLNERNNEILKILTDLGAVDGEPEIGKEISAKEGSENQTTGLKDFKGNDNATVQDLIKEYNNNCSLIKGFGDQINKRIANNQKINETVTKGIEDIAIKGQSVEDTAVQVATGLIQDGVQKITDTVTSEITKLQQNAIKSFTNGAIDTTTAATAPGMAAGIEASTLGFGSGEAARVLANGVADGIASGVRMTTGSAALGGIVSSVAAGQSLGNAIASNLAQSVTNMVNSEINSLVNSTMEGLMGQNEELAVQTQTLTEENLTNKA